MSAAAATHDTTTAAAATTATTTRAVISKRCLDDDGVCLNATVFEGVQYPNARAARIARDALRAAQQYYQLFFECDCSCHNNSNNNNNNNNSSHTLPPPHDASATHDARALPSPLTSSPPPPPPACSQHHAMQLHRLTAQHTAAYYSRTPSSATLQSTHMSPNVLDSAYHTFFPPVLSPRHRERIIATILGHAPSPYSRWKWHKAAAYASMHARALQASTTAATATTSAAAATSTVATTQQAQPQAVRADASSSSNIVPPLPHVHATATTDNNNNNNSSRSSNCSGSNKGSPTTHVTTTAVAMTSPRYFPLVPHTIVQHPHTQRLTSAEAAAAAAAASSSSSSLLSSAHHVHTHNNSSGSSADAHGMLPRDDGTTTTTTSAALLATSPVLPALPAAQPATTAATAAVATTAATTATVTPVASDAVVYTFPTSQQGPEYFHAAAEDGTRTLILVMVGLPARGKTFLAQKICRLLSWHGCKATVHNLQLMWRRALLETLSRQHHNDDTDTNDNNNNNNDKANAQASHEDAAAAQHTCSSSSSSASGCIRAEHFAQLIGDTTSTARRIYRDVLHSVADDCRRFFAHDNGEVVVLNDDFVTESLRREAEAVLRPLASQLIFMEVVREAADNVPFNECKVRDVAEYPPDVIAADDARDDFARRVALLERAYEPLRDASYDDDDDEDEHNANAAVSTTQTTTTTNSSRKTREQQRRRGRRRRACIKVRYPDVVEVHGVSGYAASRIVSYVMNITQAKMQHPIYFVRHGESCYNLEDRIGGDPLLTAQGMRDAAALLEFLYSLKAQLQSQHTDDRHNNHHNTRHHRRRRCAPCPGDADTLRGGDAAVDDDDDVCSDDGHAACTDGNDDQQQQQHDARDDNSSNSSSAHATTASPHGGADELEIWTSQLRRAIQTAELSERLLNIRTLRWSSLNEIHAGVCEGMTYQDVMTRYPLIDQFRKHSKYTFRYPDGESYQDLVVRLEPVIMELENANKVVVVVAHQAVLRCLLAYFGSTSAERSVRVRVPHRTVWRCTYDSKGVASLDELTLDNVEVGFSWRSQSHHADGDGASGRGDGDDGSGGGGGGGDCYRYRTHRDHHHSSSKNDADAATVDAAGDEIELDVI